MTSITQAFRVAAVKMIASALGVRDSFHELPASTPALRKMLSHIQKTILGYADYNIFVAFEGGNPKNPINHIRVDYVGAHPFGETAVPMTNTSFTITPNGENLKIHEVNIFQSVNNVSTNNGNNPVIESIERTVICDLKRAKELFGAFCSFTWDASGASESARQRRNFTPCPTDRMPT